MRMIPHSSPFASEAGVLDAPAPMQPRVQVSVVIPVLNEAENVAALCQRLRRVLDECAASYEIIFVAGGSRDGTEEMVLRERASDPRIKLLWLSRNFGHQEAISAGLDFATGDAVITMDGDLQHPPEALSQLLARWREGYEVVTTTRLSTADAGVVKRTASRWFYTVLNRMSDLNLQPGSADFRLMDRKAVDALQRMPERSRFLRGMVRWIGFRQIEVAYHADGRGAGITKYSLWRQLRFAASATVAFSATPLYFVTLFGFVLAAASFVYGLYAIVAKLIADISIEGWASVLVMVTFIGGVQLISFGIAGAYIAKIYEEAKGRPLYFVHGAYGFDSSDNASLALTRAQPQPHVVTDA